MGQGLGLQLRFTPVAALRFLVVGDHAVFRAALAPLLRTQADTEVVGKGGPVQEAINAARALGPDVVLLDVHMPDGSGIEAAAAIKKGRPQTQVVILTSDEEESVLQSAIQAGVTGYLSKHETAAQVVQAERSAARGEALIAPYMLARLVRGLQKKDRAGPATPLTPRELEGLRELSMGHDNEAGAKNLKMSPNTVRTHVQNILSKLNVHSKLEAVSRGIREGWIRIPQEPAA